MRTKPECFDCQIKIWSSVLNSFFPKNLREKTLERIAKEMARNFSPDRVPDFYYGTRNYRLIHKAIKKDVFRSLRKKANRIASQAAKRLEKNLSLKEALRYAALGNVLDFLHLNPKDAFELLKKKKRLAIDEREKALKLIQKYDEMVYIADNAGEIVLDFLFIKKLKEMGKRVFLIARRKPLANDVTCEEIRELGLDKLVDKLICLNCFGVPIPLPKKLEKLFKNRLIISKGQAAYCSISELNYDTIFLLSVKCKPIADDLKVKEGKFLIKVRRKR